MRIYQIYVPELGTFVKYKVLDQEDIKTFIDELTLDREVLSEQEYFYSLRKIVLENFIFNLKSDVSESLRLMSRKSAEDTLNALYAGAVMLNPSLDVDTWLAISYGKSIGKMPDDIDDESAEAFFKALRNSRKSSKTPKLDEDDFPFLQTKKEKKSQKPKPISKQKFLGLENHLKSCIIGQDDAVNVVISALKRSQAGIADIERPVGVFLFAGSSGVGKTHFANTLHKYLFGTDSPMVRIDCGEFQHKHENQKLIGSPPGYVGHDEGGQLVNLVKQKPNTVVLLDEIEKAHPDLWNTFLRVFDDGILTDGKGEIVDFRNTIIIMTTNLGNDKTADHLLAGGTGFTKDINYKTKTKVIPDRNIIEKNTNDAIKKHFKPEFLNRIDKIVTFNYLSLENCQKIARLELSIVIDKLSRKGYQVEYSDSVIEALIEKGIDSIKGARGLAQIRREQIETKIADYLINNQIPRGSTFFIDFNNDIFEFKLQKPKKELEI